MSAIFSKLTKRSATCPFLRIGNHGSRINCSPLPVVRNFSKLLRFIILERDLCCLKLKLNILQHVFAKSKYAITKLLNCFDFQLAIIQYHVNAIYFGLSGALDFVSHSLLPVFFYRLLSCKLISYIFRQHTIFSNVSNLFTAVFVILKYFKRICFVALLFVISVKGVCNIIIPLNPSRYFTEHRLKHSKILNSAHICINLVGMELRTDSEYWPLLN